MAKIASFCELVAQTIFTCISQWGFFFVLILADLLLHWIDVKLDLTELSWIFLVFVCILVVVGLLHMWIYRRYYDPTTVQDTEDIQFAGPSYKLIDSCRKGKSNFKDFAKYVPELTKILSFFKLTDVILGICVVFSATLLGLATLNDRADLLLGIEQEQMFSMVDRMNVGSFLVTFLGPFLVVMAFSLKTRTRMLENTTFTEDTTKLADIELESNGFGTNRTSCHMALTMSALLLCRVFYLILFEFWTDIDWRFEQHQPLCYMVAVGAIALFQIYITQHTIRMRNQWYNGIELIKSKKNPANDDDDDEAVVFFPPGVNVFFTATQLLCSTWLMRALFSAIVTYGEEGEHHRVSPVFFDFLVSLVLILSMRYLLFSDYPLLDLMEDSRALNQARDDFADGKAPVVGENVGLMHLPNSFHSATPTY
jgi:hypothetical protein